MLYTIKIDRQSISKNPNAGFSGPYFMPGIIETRPDGSVCRNITPYHTIGKEPKYFFKYIYPEITCEHCAHVFPFNQLEDEEYYDEEDNEEYYRDNICPRCKLDECCEIRWEKIQEVVVKEEDNDQS